MLVQFYLGFQVLLVGTKDVGDSVRRLMGRMFIDDVLTEYSLLGKKKKKTSQNCLFINF